MNSIKDLVLEIIDRLVEMRGYRPTGAILGMEGGQVQMLHERTWYPKTRAAENRLLEKLMIKRKEIVEVEKSG